MLVNEYVSPMYLMKFFTIYLFDFREDRSLVRFRCVSKHWDRLISDPYLAKAISQRKILLQFQHLYTIDHDNIPIQDTAQSMVRLSCDFGNINIKDVTIVGIFNGIVLLVLKDTSLCTHMILYNPFTQGYNKVPDPPVTPQQSSYNIGFGSTQDDFKIVRLFKDKTSDDISYSCYVFSVKNNDWSNPTYFRGNFLIRDNNVGMFLNGLLYWIGYNNIWALDVKNVTLSKITIPDRCYVTGFTGHSYGSRQWSYSHYILGGLHGSLCMINTGDCAKFNLWVMKEQGVENLWSRVSSFTLSFERNYHDKLVYGFKVMFFPIRVMDNGRILLTNSLNQVIIYDTSNDSDKTFNFVDVPDSTVFGIEYVQCLLSPSNMCSV